MSLTQEEAHRLFEYKDGVLYWKERPRSDFKSNGSHIQWNERYAKQVAGSIVGKYANVSINKIRHQVHRIVFLMQHGYLPEIVDHIDGNRQNNKIENLRSATHTQNLQNSKLPKHNLSGYKNVGWHKQRKKWRAQIEINGKVKHLGLFTDEHEAHLVYQNALNNLEL